MAGGRGGYRRPSKPAPVSGPGALSKRTDGQPIREVGGFEYGGRQEFEDIQSAAPMSSSGVEPAPMRAVPLTAATERPDEPVTAGAALGAGPGPSPIPRQGTVAERLMRMRSTDGSAEALAELAFRLGV